MQDYKTLHSNLTKILARHISDPQELLEKLVAITGKDYKSIWRRMRGEYKFSFDEVFNICNELGISIESLSHRDAASISTLHLYQYPAPLTFNMDDPHIRKVYATMENAVKCEDGTYTCVCNRMPEIFHIGKVKLSQLLLTKHHYFIDPLLDTGFYRYLNDNWDLFVKNNIRYADTIASFRNMVILWGPNIMNNLVSDVKFFRDIDIITDMDVRMIKEELIEVVERIDWMCREQSATRERNFVFAVSPIDMNFHSAMITSSGANQVIYFLYHLAFTYTENESEICLQKKITDCLMKGAINLSGSNHKERNLFIKKQLEEIKRI